MDLGNPLELCVFCLWYSAALQAKRPARLFFEDVREKSTRMETVSYLRVGINAHKKSCMACVFDSSHEVLGWPMDTFVFNTKREGVQEFMKKVPEKSIVVIETSTTGKVLLKILSSKYDIHLAFHRMKEKPKSKRIVVTQHES
jgi:hypothetical protein